mmetsp:Transcript_4432/g.9268  ORF Transcript_4432/g.9268 Transcript_4432/m.9268 type:complete len:271 (+) Transcript_4432:558-1370(+)
MSERPTNTGLPRLTCKKCTKRLSRSSGSKSTKNKANKAKRFRSDHYCGIHQTTKTRMIFFKLFQQQLRNTQLEILLWYYTTCCTTQPVNNALFSFVLYWSIQFPLAIVPYRTIGTGFRSITMGFAVDPLPLVDAAIYPMILSYPMANSPSPLSSIHTSILERIRPLSVPLSLQKASHIGGPVRPLVYPVPVPLVIPEISLKYPSVPPFVDANPMPLVRLVVSLVRVAIGIVGFSVAVPLSVLPPSTIDSTVRIPHGSERTGNRTVLNGAF